MQPGGARIDPWPLIRTIPFWRRRVRDLGGGIDFDSELRIIWHDEGAIRLSRREAELLTFLLQHRGRSFSPRELAAQAWRTPHLSAAQVRNYVVRLRRKLHGAELPRTLICCRSTSGGQCAVQQGCRPQPTWPGGSGVGDLRRRGPPLRGRRGPHPARARGQSATCEGPPGLAHATAAPDGAVKGAPVLWYTAVRQSEWSSTIPRATR
jgi:Transcriptional regulatory protein, C terminal